MPHDPASRSTVAPWIVMATVEPLVILPSGDILDRDDFHAWLWDQAGGLLGIDEGSVTAADAAARGFVPSCTVIDAAAAPSDRDWVARLAEASEAWWFGDEAAARAAADLVAGARGCTVRGVRADVPFDHEGAARAAFGPIDVVGFGVVRPAWDEGSAVVDAAGLATVFVEPGLGFGTGLHPTTQLCLAAVSRWRRHGGRFDRVLDFGSGSGILGISAAVLGARHVDAVEIDDRVHPAIVANARRNGVADKLVVAADLAVGAAPYDVVVANIVPQVLFEHAIALCSLLDRRHGLIALSGLCAADVPRVTACYAALLGSQPDVREADEWRCLSFTRG